MQSAYLCVIIHVKQLPFLFVLTWFLILCNIQDGGKDGNHCWWRNRPPAVPPFIEYILSCWEDQRLFSEGKIASKYCSISKTLGRGSIYHPLVPWWGVWFCVYVWGLSWQGRGWFCMRLHFYIKVSFVIDTKGLYCVTKGNISFSSLSFCFRSAAFLLWVLLLIAIFISKLCGQPLSINRFLKSEMLPQRSLFVGYSRPNPSVKSILTFGGW